jgi:hypothetical protein
MAETLKYDRTSDGVHIWRHTDGSIFCAASGNDRTATNCYPLAQQYVNGSTASAVPSPNPSPSSNQSGDVFGLICLVGAMVLVIVGGVTLSYVLAPPPQRYAPEPDEPELEPAEPVGKNPDGSQGSEGSGSQKVQEGSPEVQKGSPGVQKSTAEGSDDEDDLEPGGSEGSGEVQSEYARMPIAQFREALPPGNIDPRTLSLAEYREMAKEIVWRFYCKTGVTNRQKLAWICTGATKGGSQAWTLTDQFLKEACPVMFNWGHTPKYTNQLDGGF